MRKLISLATLLAVVTGCGQVAGPVTSFAMRPAQVRSASDAGVKKAVEGAFHTLFDEADKNKDGKISSNETKLPIEIDRKMFKAIDRDGSNDINPAEYVSYFANMPEFKREFAGLKDIVQTVVVVSDEDGNGQIDGRELRWAILGGTLAPTVLDHVPAADENRDGSLSASELEDCIALDFAAQLVAFVRSANRKK